MTDTNTSSSTFTAADLINDGPPVPVEIEGLVRGKTGIIHVKLLPAGDVLEFTERVKSDGNADAMLDFVAKAVVNPDGSPMFTDQTLRNHVPARIFNSLAKAVSEVNAISTESPEGE